MKQKTNYNNISELYKWYQRSPLADCVAYAIEQQLCSILPDCFGYQLLQFGLPQRFGWLDASPIKEKWIISPLQVPHKHYICGEYSELPFANETIDCVVLPHTLELFSKPRRFLDEVDRILVPEGHMIIIGLNPYSSWGLRQRLAAADKKFQWCQQMYSQGQLQRMLAAEGYLIQQVRGFFYRPPVSDNKSLQKLLFMESAGRILAPLPAGLYCILAQKRISQPTIITPKWAISDWVWGKRQVESATQVFRDKIVSANRHSSR